MLLVLTVCLLGIIVFNRSPCSPSCSPVQRSVNATVHNMSKKKAGKKRRSQKVCLVKKQEAVKEDETEIIFEEDRRVLRLTKRKMKRMS